MEFNFNIDNVVGESPFLVDKDLLPALRSPESIQANRKHLCEIIDKLGYASAKAQNLPGPITSATKLSFTDQQIYIYKSASLDGGVPTIVGFIKVGRKRLFVYDRHGNQKELEPLCVLDFYIQESRQRSGYGKRLFEHMLRMEDVQPVHLAIDRPSPKFIGFLAKHYGLKASIPQVNNYVIYEGFFSGRNEQSSSLSKKAKHKPAGSAVPVLNSNLRANGPSSAGNTATPSGGRLTLNAMPPTGTALLASAELESLSAVHPARSSSHESFVAPHETQSLSELKDGNATLGSDTIHNSLTADIQSAKPSRGHSAKSSAYSRHASHSAPFEKPFNQDYKEPIRTRYATSQDNPKDIFNSHHRELTKQGHLRVTSQISHTAKDSSKQLDMTGITPEDWTSNFHGSAGSKGINTTWNIFGVPAGYSTVAHKRPT